jgi:hypothetical protein
MASEPHEQAELIIQAASTRKDRAGFLADPRKYAEERNVELDAELIGLVSQELETIERSAAMLGMRNKHLDERKVDISDLRYVDLGKSPIRVAAWPLVAYYVVTTAAAVVSAVSTTYLATKWLKPNSGDTEIAAVVG